MIYLIKMIAEIYFLSREIWAILVSEAREKMRKERRGTREG